MIKIQKSKTADTRSCDYANVTREQLYDSTVQHIGDVKAGLDFFSQMMSDAANRHDYDKKTNLRQFHADFVTGFVQQSWYQNHIKVNRHHLAALGGVPEGVNLIDVMEMICDCVMAGMGRTGTVTPIKIDADILEEAVNNTVELLKSQIVVE